MELKRQVSRLFDACTGMHQHQPAELLRWIVGDVLAGFGIDTSETPPPELSGWLRAQSAEYARLVIARPFEDVLGTLYQMLGSQGHRSQLGQYFTPPHVADVMAAIAASDLLAGQAEAGTNGRLLRMCEPSCGSGALVLGFLRTLIERGGRDGPRRWSITAIDIDPLCARICAAQVLANAFLGQIELGELLVYAGNALAPEECWCVVVHASSHDMRPDVVLPALHPSRVEALRQTAKQEAWRPVQDKEEAAAGEQAKPQTTSSTRATAKEEADRAAASRQVDLFAE